MERTLKLYTFVDGVSDLPFPNSSQDPIEVTSFTYSANRMGGAPSLTFTLMWGECLDNLWSEKVYAEFRGEKYFINNIPTSSFSNADARYKHEVTLYSERQILDNVYFYDVVSGDVPVPDKPVSNSAKVVFFGGIDEFTKRLNLSLQYAKLQTVDGDGNYVSGYHVIVDEGITSEEKLMSFDKKFFSEVLQEVYNTYNIPYYFNGKEIHIGETQNEIGSESAPLKYGINDALLSISKANANNKIVNRATGEGSSDNIPYYYPNSTPYGDVSFWYNGSSDSGKVQVVDWQRFSSHLSPKDYLAYKRIDKQSKTQIASIDDFTTQNTWHPYPDACVWYGDFELTIPEDCYRISIPASCVPPAYTQQLLVENSSRERIFDGTYLPASKALMVEPKSKYKISIYVSVPSDDVLAGSTVEQVAKKLCSANIYSIKSYVEEGWYINGNNKIELSSCGVKFSGEPSNGDNISFVVEEGTKIPNSSVLLPPIYRETGGAERFYNAINLKHHKPESEGGFYYFDNPYTEVKPREEIVDLSDIKPTIKGITNASGLAIDMFSEFAYDEDDNDETNEDGTYLHSHFFGKLRRFNGVNGFNLFDHALDGGSMTIEMTSGPCGACKWKIKVDEDTQKNVVQVDVRGNLIRDDKGNVVTYGVGQDRQNDTKNYEVWVALEKDTQTFGTIMPNATNQYRPNAGDTFVITGIRMPEAYIYAAEEKLMHEILSYMSNNNTEKFNFSIKFSRIFLAENPTVAETLSENSSIYLHYNNNIVKLFVSDYSYKIGASTDALPEITVSLNEEITISKNAIQKTVSALSRKFDMAIPILKKEQEGHFLKKDADDVVLGRTTFNKQASFIDGISSSGPGSSEDSSTGSWLIKKDSYGNSILEIDKIKVRQSLDINTLVVNQTDFQKGTIAITKGGCVVESVEEGDGFYRCFFDNKNGSFFSGFAVGDLARCDRYDESYSDIVKYYWRKVVGVGSSHVDLSYIIGEYDGEGIPTDGDNIIQLGNAEDLSRQSAIVISPDDGGSVKVYSGISTFTLNNKDYVGLGVNPYTNRAYLYGYGDMFFGDRNLEKQFITYQIPEGGTEPEMFVKANIEIGENSKGLSNLSEFKDVESTIQEIKSQTEEEFTMWFGEDEPTLTNYPASDWTTEELISLHEKDIYYSDGLGKAWRFLSGAWVEITDARTLAALEKIAEVETKVDNVEYIKSVFPNSTVVSGATLSQLLAVMDSDNNVVAGLYGGGVEELNANGYKDSEHGTLMIFAGADGVNNVSNAKSRVYEDGHAVFTSAEISGVLFRKAAVITASNFYEYFFKPENANVFVPRDEFEGMDYVIKGLPLEAWESSGGKSYFSVTFLPELPSDLDGITVNDYKRQFLGSKISVANRTGNPYSQINVCAFSSCTSIFVPDGEVVYCELVCDENSETENIYIKAQKKTLSD